jgi:ABC-type Mn2+/Zn2+ transport system permease subunit
MTNDAKGILGSPLVRTLVVLVLIVPISVYLGTSTVRRGILYYLEVFAPAVVLGVAVGLWTWSWRSFWSTLAIGVGLTVLTQLLVSLFWR